MECKIEKFGTKKKRHYNLSITEKEVKLSDTKKK